MNKSPMMTRTVMIAVMVAACGVTRAQDVADRTYHPDGQLSEARWVENGRVQFVKYHANGEIQERGAFAEGRPDGVWKQFDAEGHLTARVRFVKGQLEGRCLQTSFDGRTQYQLDYVEGRLVHAEQYDASGALVAERDMR